MNPWKSVGVVGTCAGLWVMGTCGVSGSDVALFEYALDVEGVVSNPGLGDPVPPGVYLGHFDTVSGLGTMEYSVSGAGPHRFGVYVDHEIDEAINTFFNEYGEAVGIPEVGLSWEIDEPGFVFGDIYDHFILGTLDNSTGVPAGAPDDVSMALAWDFSLGLDEIATIRMYLRESAPGEDFYLVQTDPDSGSMVYLSSSLTIRGMPNPLPEGSFPLIEAGLGIAALAWLQRRSRR